MMHPGHGGYGGPQMSPAMMAPESHMSQMASMPPQHMAQIGHVASMPSHHMAQMGHVASMPSHLMAQPQMPQPNSIAEMGRSPTFVVGSDRQRGTLDALVRRDQHLSEGLTNKHKPLCFNAKSYQKTHPRKAAQGYNDADACLVSPMLVAVADGVSQIEEFGIDASELPNELLSAVEELAVNQLLPDRSGEPTGRYTGPIAILKEAYESTESEGSTTVLMAVMDNSTKIHGVLHPMIAVCSVGDCEIMILRRTRDGRLDQVFHSEMQRIDGNVQSPLQVARVGPEIDPNFDEDMAIEVIERGSAVHCISAHEGDIVVLGSDGVFDNMYVDEIVQICDEMLPQPYPYARMQPTSRSVLFEIARRIVLGSHSKTQQLPTGGWPPAPLRGGKADDTSCVVGEVVEWKREHSDAWVRVRRQKQWQSILCCGMGGVPACDDEDESLGESHKRSYPQNPDGSFSTTGGSFSEYGQHRTH